MRVVRVVGLGTNDVGDRDATTVVTMLVRMLLVEPTMCQAGPSQGKPHDQGETERGK